MTSASSNESHSPSPSSGSEHERSGSGGGKAKKHVCPTCDRAFTTSGHLARHARVHTGERNHHCPFPGCNTRCSRQDNLQQHYRVHLSPRSRNISTSAARAEMARRALAQQQQQHAAHPPPLAASQLPQFADAPFMAARPMPTSAGAGWWPDSSSPSTHTQTHSPSSYYSSGQMSYGTPSPSPYTTPSPDAAYFRSAPHSLDAYVPPAPLPLGARFYTPAHAHAQQQAQPYPWKVEDRQAY